MGDVAGVCHAMEGQRMVFAQRKEGNGPLDDLTDPAVRTATTLRRNGGEEPVVALVTHVGGAHRPEEPPGRLAGSGGAEVHPEGLEDLGDVPLEPLPVLVADPPGVYVLPEHDLFGVTHARHEIHASPPFETL